MPKVKISEYSATANSNTDVASINIDEGCAPSGINNAIRAVMGHLKDFQQGTNGDPFNGPVNGTVGATTANTGAFTTLTTTGTINLITVGRGAGAVATNTAVGASALAANTSGAANAVFGYDALKANTTGYDSVAVGHSALLVATTATNNTAVGRAALAANTTASNNTGLGYVSLASNTTGASNTAVGANALQSNTTADRNTAVGYQAGYTNTTNIASTFVGYRAGYLSTGAQCTFVGDNAGQNSTGTLNGFFGQAAGYLVTSGAKNTILGSYTGNQGGLDIRTASNYIVLSDGDGGPKAYNGNNVWFFGDGSAVQSGDIRLNGQASSGWGPVIGGYTGTPGSLTGRWYAGSNSWIKGGTAYDTFTVMAGASGGVNLAAAGTSWTSASDERLKDIIEPITDAANKVCTIRAVIGKYKTDDEGKRRSFLIAQDVQAVLPEAVSESRNSKEDTTEYLQLAYTDVIPLLVAAIKELKAEVDSLKAQINGASA